MARKTDRALKGTALRCFCLAALAAIICCFPTAAAAQTCAEAAVEQRAIRTAFLLVGSLLATVRRLARPFSSAGRALLQRGNRGGAGAFLAVPHTVVMVRCFVSRSISRWLRAL